MSQPATHTPRQNRVTPAGEIISTPERGTLMGNRGGALHDAQGRIVRAWRDTRWIVCLLEFGGRWRPVMQPGLYTELFFLDEATALAAGHRPCAQCQRGRFDAFQDAWPVAGASGQARAGEIDERLHDERLGEGGTKRTHRAPLAGLPDGAFVRLPGRGDVAWLIWRGRLLAWSPGGYCEALPLPPLLAEGGEVEVLTPPSTVAAIRAGYIPEVHPSALPA